YLDPELNLCICFDKFKKTNEPLVPLAFDLDQLPSNNPAINSIQDILEGFQLEDTSKLRCIFLIHNLIKFSTSTLKHWRSLNRKRVNFTKNRKINFKSLIQVEIIVLLTIFKTPFTYQKRILEAMKGQIGKCNSSIWEVAH
ncbi:uncharacterized protein VP01_1022g8, partial [Puccinia sorghi]